MSRHDTLKSVISKWLAGSKSSWLAIFKAIHEGGIQFEFDECEGPAIPGPMSISQTKKAAVPSGPSEQDVQMSKLHDYLCGTGKWGEELEEFCGDLDEVDLSGEEDEDGNDSDETDEGDDGE